MDKQRLPRRVYDWELDSDTKRSWTDYTEKILKELGLGRFWETQQVEESKDEWNKLIEKRIQTREQDKWWKAVRESPKLRTYRLVKTKLQFEEYLNNDDQKGRRILARLRSGTNSLRIETGRWEGLRRGRRLCWFGCREMEDETHFFLHCKLCDDLRENFIDKVGEEEFQKRGLLMFLGEGSDEEIKNSIIYAQRATARRRRSLELRG